MKTTLIRDIYNDSDIIKMIRQYQSFLIEHTIELNLTLENLYNATSRVKTPNSIEDKIDRYNSNKHQNGKIPIYKCLNDIFGARIFIDEEKSFEQIQKSLQNKYNDTPYKLKCIDSSKNGYKATHVYFIKRKNNKKEGENSIFQWELQIWSANNIHNNFESHKKHKQGYINWENKITLKEG